MAEVLHPSEEPRVTEARRTAVSLFIHYRARRMDKGPIGAPKQDWLAFREWVEAWLSVCEERMERK